MGVLLRYMGLPLFVCAACPLGNKRYFACCCSGCSSGGDGAWGFCATLVGKPIVVVLHSQFRRTFVGARAHNSLLFLTYAGTCYAGIMLCRHPKDLIPPA